MSHPGRLVVFEGPDHVGRSTHARFVTERLEAHGVASVTFGLARSRLLGDQIKREGPEIHDYGSRTRALLYATDLHDQLIHEIMPAYRAGYVVIADRYTITPVVREEMRGAPLTWLQGLYDGAPSPDASIILDIGPRRLLDRVLYTQGGLERLSRYECGLDLGLGTTSTTSFLAYQKKMRKRFRQIAGETGAHIVSTNGTPLEVHSRVWEAILPVVSEMLEPIQITNDSNE